MSEKREGKKYLPVILRGDSIDSPPLVVVVSHPSKDDLSVESFGEEGFAVSEMRYACEQAGLPWSHVHVTGTIRCGIGSRTTPTKEEIEQNAQTLKDELAFLKPKLVMAMGAQVFKTIMKKNVSMTDYLGEVMEPTEAFPYPLMANYAPGMLLADPTKRADFQYVFEYAKEIVGGEINRTPYTFEVVTDPKRNIEILEGYLAKGLTEIGYDGEWFGHHWMDDEVMFDFQYSMEENHAVILSISEDGKTENRELLDTMKLVLENPGAKRYGWNIRVDDIRLRHRGIMPLDETLAFDGMKAIAFFDSRLGKGLESGIRHFTNYPHYWLPLQREMKKLRLKGHELAQMKFYNRDIYNQYCAGDAVSHLTACRNMLAQFPAETRDHYFNVYLPLSHYLTDMEMVGIPIDKECLREITELYTKKYAECREQLAESLKRLYGVEDFNPNSAPQKKTLLFETLKLEPAFWTKSGKSPKPAAWYVKQSAETQKMYAPSTNAASLSTMQFQLTDAARCNPDNRAYSAALEVVQNLLKVSRIGVFATKFLSRRGLDKDGNILPVRPKKKKARKSKGEPDPEAEDQEDEAIEELSEDEEGNPLKQSYWTAINRDGRIHASFFECLKNFRASSSPNVQNPASKVLSHIPEIFVPGFSKLSKEEQKLHSHEIPKNIRNIFYSGDPDYYWAELDVAGADLAIMAFLSKDQDFIYDIRSGSFHQTKMRDYFQDPNLSKKDVSKYTIAKSITFRVSYTAGLKSAALPIQAAIFAESGLFVELELIEYALQTWTRYTRYMNFRDECTSEVQSNRSITNSRKQRLTYDETDNFGVIAGWMNESLAFPVASELANFLWEASLNLKRHLKQYGLWMTKVFPTNSVHDAGYWLVHKSLLEGNYFQELLKYVFCHETRLSTGDTVGCEVVIADRWKGKQHIFEGETKWCFDTNQWLWK